MTAVLPPDEPPTIFYIGHHETDRTEAASNGVLQQAQDLGYDFLTSSITTSAFHERVVSLVKDFQSQGTHGHPLPLISPLTPADSSLTPEDSNTSRIAVTSSWIDLGSDDQVIAHASRQVFNLEVAYAAFCGINNVLVQGPMEDSDPVQYARAVQEALGLGPYLQLHVFMPMRVELESEGPNGMHLSELAKSPTPDLPEDGNENDFSVWETWDTIRFVCNYSQKLSIGMDNNFHFTSIPDSFYSVNSPNYSRQAPYDTSRYLCPLMIP
jgi:protein arginine N-methyltransferase 5